MGLGPMSPHHLRDATLPLKPSASRNSLLASKSMTAAGLQRGDGERPEGPPRRTLGQVVRAFGARLEAFVTRPFLGGGERESTLVPGPLTVLHGEPRPANAAYRASTGCILPAPPAANGPGGGGGGRAARPALSPSGISTSISANHHGAAAITAGGPAGGGSGGVVLPAIVVRRAESRLYRASEPEFSLFTPQAESISHQSSMTAAPPAAGGSQPAEIR